MTTVDPRIAPLQVLIFRAFSDALGGASVTRQARCGAAKRGGGPPSGGGLSNPELQKRLKEHGSQVSCSRSRWRSSCRPPKNCRPRSVVISRRRPWALASHHWQLGATRSARVHPHRRVRPRPVVLRWAPPAQRAPSSPGRRAALRPRGAAARRRGYRSARRGLARQRHADLGAPPSMPPCAAARSKRECPRIDPGAAHQ